MLPILWLSLRQLTGRWRLAIVLLLTALPIALAAVVSALSEGPAGDDGIVDVLFDGLIVAAILPLATMSLATASFGNEVEDRTLSYLTLKPVSRYLIVLPKLLASIIVTGPLMIASGVVATLLLFDGDVQAALAVAAALLAGVAAYTAIFMWAGLVSGSALAFSLIYVFVWEGVISTFLGGVRYLSVRGYALATMYGMDDESFEVLQGRVIEFPAAIVGAAAVTVVFFWLTVRRLRTMDVP